MRFTISIREFTLLYNTFLDILSWIQRNRSLSTTEDALTLEITLSDGRRQTQEMFCSIFQLSCHSWFIKP